MKLYHYTNGIKIRKIIESGEIKMSPERPKPMEKRICWLSSHPLWEKTANKIMMTETGSQLLNEAETEQMCGGLFRFVIDSETYPDKIIQWPRLGVEARIPPNVKKRLIDRAQKANVQPTQWFGTLNPIQIQYCTLEMKVNGSWESVDFDKAKPLDNPFRVLDGGAQKYLPTSDDEWKHV